MSGKQIGWIVWIIVLLIKLGIIQWHLNMIFFQNNKAIVNINHIYIMSGKQIGWIVWIHNCVQ